MDTDNPTLTPDQAEDAIKRIFPGTTEVESANTPSRTPGFDQFLHDLFTTAIEGGINYWAGVINYHHWINPGAPNSELQDDLLGFYADIEDMEYGDTAYHVNRRIIARGWRKLNTHTENPLGVSVRWRDRICWSSGGNPPLVWTEDCDWDYDAGDADVILQLGLFDDVVYG